MFVYSSADLNVHWVLVCEKPRTRYRILIVELGSDHLYVQIHVGPSRVSFGVAAAKPSSIIIPSHANKTGGGSQDRPEPWRAKNSRLETAVPCVIVYCIRHISHCGSTDSVRKCGSGRSRERYARPYKSRRCPLQQFGCCIAVDRSDRAA
jgi:hypothetical protein